jgi:hypothetical protein
MKLSCSPLFAPKGILDRHSRIAIRPSQEKRTQKIRGKWGKGRTSAHLGANKCALIAEQGRTRAHLLRSRNGARQRTRKTRGQVGEGANKCALVAHLGANTCILVAQQRRTSAHLLRSRGECALIAQQEREGEQVRTYCALMHMHIWGEQAFAFIFASRPRISVCLWQYVRTYGV